MADGLSVSRRERRALAADNRKQPTELRQVPHAEWPLNRPRGITELWRSREFLVQVFDHEAAVRLSVCRTVVGGGERWADGITWDELQRLKRECGRGDKAAVEIYPPDAEVVNDANMRHLWVMREPISFAWRRS